MEENRDALIIKANRQEYDYSRIGRRTMTVRELIEYLEHFDDDVLVYTSQDDGYTYGGITNWEMVYIEAEEEEEE